MPDHYFSQQPGAAHQRRELSFAYRGRELSFATDAGTFSMGRVDPGSRLLLEAMGEIQGDCADVGCGWGAIGISLASANPGATLWLTDVNARALELARENMRINGVSNARTLQGDALEPVEGPLDQVVTNPPIRAGKAVVQRIFAQAHEKLRPGGALTAVLRKAQGASSAKAHLAELFGNCETVARGGGYHVLRSIKEQEV